MKSVILGAALFAACALPLSVLAAPASAPEKPSVALLIRESGKALGVSALPGITTIYQRGPLTLFGAPGTADTWVDVRSGANAQHVEAGPLSNWSGFDGKHNWSRDPSGVVVDDSDEGARIIAIDSAYLNAYELWRPDRGGAKVTSLGVRTEKSVTYDVLSITPPSSIAFELWIDAKTHLPERSVITLGPLTASTVFSDYHAVHGLQVPDTQVSTNPSGVVTSHATETTANTAEAQAQLLRPTTSVHDFGIAGGTSATVPIALVDNHVALDITINGKGPYHFLFDTGGRNLLDAGVAKELGLTGAGSMNGAGVGATTEAFQFATVKDLGLGGGVTLHDQGFILAPVRAGFGMSSSAPVDGLIGWEVLARFVTTFDYANKTVMFRMPDSAPTASYGTALPFVFAGTQPVVQCAMNGITGDCAIDTGSRSSIDLFSPFVAAHPSLVSPAATAVGANGFGVGGASLGKLERIDVTIGGFDVPNTIAGVSTATEGAFANPYGASNIGGGLLRRFTVTFDYPHTTMYLQRNADFLTAEHFDHSGLFLVNGKAGITVASVREGTPADGQLKPGDVILTVDGLDATKLGLGALRESLGGPPGTVERLTVQTGTNAPRAVTLTLAAYV